MSDSPSEEIAARIVREVAADPWLGHKTFFSGPNDVEDAPYHREIANIFWMKGRKQILGFRGCGKSTKGERNLVLASVMRIFKNIVLIGSNVDRAAERLEVVDWHLLNNERILQVFGNVKGKTWHSTKKVLVFGNCIQALGRDQDIRGIKHLDWRPDCVFVDDFEDKESVQTVEQRRKTFRWFLGELCLACEPTAHILVNGTPLDPESVPMRLWKSAGWPTRIIPVEYIGEDSRRRSAWPAKFPLSWIDQEKATYVKTGEAGLWAAEMMCDPQAEELRTFRRDHFKIQERPRSWHAVTAMIDPARTTNRTSATTGWAVWSWISGRLHVWAAGASMLMPDQIIDLMFTLHEEFNLVFLGVEKTGLSEWLSQPVRQAQAQRGIVLPYVPVEAFRGDGQTNFIRGLQPFYAAGEVTHQRAFPELEEQLMNFPTGKRDAPNALAYALTMRPGQLVYDNFIEEHIDADLVPVSQRTLHLAANATASFFAAALVQVVEGQLRILADWAIEGPADMCVADVYAEAGLAGDASATRLGSAKDDFLRTLLKLPARASYVAVPIRWVVPPIHADQWHNVGLIQAINHIPANVSQGSDQTIGRRAFRELLSRDRRGLPALAVSTRAAWTLRALTGGYSYPVNRSGNLAANPVDSPYKILMEGIESFAGMMARGKDEEAEGQNFSYNRAGQRYLSIIPERARGRR